MKITAVKETNNQQTFCKNPKIKPSKKSKELIQKTVKKIRDVHEHLYNQEIEDIDRFVKVSKKINYSILFNQFGRTKFLMISYRKSVRFIPNPLEQK